MGTEINGYALLDDFTTANAGMCKWGFAKKNGHEYFIKEFLSPKYPMDESLLGPELTKKMRESADAFFYKKKAYYGRLAACRTGNVMVNLDFFRHGAKYYAVTDKVCGDTLEIADIAKLSEDSKRTLIMSILYSMSKVHKAGIVHSDLKPENILVRKTESGYCTAKIIDFDAGFLEESVPNVIEGSQNYFAPEAVLKTNGKEIAVTTKADVFALGLLMHQYWCGKMPDFPDSYHYVSEAVLNNKPVVIDSRIPKEIGNLINRMLSQNASDRPTAEEVWKQLRGEVSVSSEVHHAAHADSRTASSIGLSAPAGDELD